MIKIRLMKNNWKKERIKIDRSKRLINKKCNKLQKKNLRKFNKNPIFNRLYQKFDKF